MSARGMLNAGSSLLHFGGNQLRALTYICISDTLKHHQNSFVFWSRLPHVAGGLGWSPPGQEGEQIRNSTLHPLWRCAGQRRTAAQTGGGKVWARARRAGRMGNGARITAAAFTYLLLEDLQ